MSEDPNPPQFLCDDHLLKLCRWLRAAGHDVAWERGIDDAVLVERARAEDRVILTLDREIARRRGAEGRVHVLASHDPEQQLEEVARAWLLDLVTGAFTRCTVCNVELEPAPDLRPPPRVRARPETYRRCPACERGYWEGTHTERLRALLERTNRRDT